MNGIQVRAAALYGLMAVLLGGLLAWTVAGEGPYRTLVMVVAGTAGGLALAVALLLTTRPGGPLATFAVVLNVALMLVWVILTSALVLDGIVASFVRGGSVLGSGVRTGVVFVAFVVVTVLYSSCADALDAVVDSWK